VGVCRVCDRKSATISSVLGVCASCVKNRFEEAGEHIARAHARVRSAYGLPPEPPRDPSGARCSDCGNLCKIPPGGVGFCGMV